MMKFYHIDHKRMENLYISNGENLDTSFVADHVLAEPVEEAIEQVRCPSRVSFGAVTVYHICSRWTLVKNPTTWATLQQANSIAAFKSLLKTHLFCEAFWTLCWTFYFFNLLFNLFYLIYLIHLLVYLMYQLNCLFNYVYLPLTNPLILTFQFILNYLVLFC